MPIYEYLCKTCGEFEVMQRITDRPLSRCPTCQKKVTKLISNTSFQLKGTGWYVTDYPRKGGKSTDGGNEPAADAKAESQADTTSKTESSSKAETTSKAETKNSKAETKNSNKTKEAAAA